MKAVTLSDKAHENSPMTLTYRNEWGLVCQSMSLGGGFEIYVNIMTSAKLS